MFQTNHLVASAGKARPVQIITFSLLLATSLSVSAQSQEPISHDRNAPLSRAEVRADLAVWQRAGLDRYEIRSRYLPYESEEYRAAYQEYLRLRSGKEFQVEVQKALKN